MPFRWLIVSLEVGSSCLINFSFSLKNFPYVYTFILAKVSAVKNNNTCRSATALLYFDLFLGRLTLTLKRLDFLSLSKLHQ